MHVLGNMGVNIGQVFSRFPQVYDGLCYLHRTIALYKDELGNLERSVAGGGARPAQLARKKKIETKLLPETVAKLDQSRNDLLRMAEGIPEIWY